MRENKILAEGRFRPEDLIVSRAESNRAIDSGMEGQIDALWEEKKRKAEADGRVCYNGISYRVNSLTQEGQTLHIELGTLEFKVREALPTIPGYFDFPEEYYRKGCYGGATVKTSDGKYLTLNSRESR